MKEYEKYDEYKRAKEHVKEVKSFYIHLIIYLVINIYALVKILHNVSPDHLNFWMFSMPFFWGIGLLFHAYGVFGKNLIFSREWEDRKIKEIMEKDKRTFWK